MPVWHIIKKAEGPDDGQNYVSANKPPFDDGLAPLPGEEGFSRDAIDAHLKKLGKTYLADYAGPSPEVMEALRLQAIAEQDARDKAEEEAAEAARVREAQAQADAQKAAQDEADRQAQAEAEQAKAAALDRIKQLTDPKGWEAERAAREAEAEFNALVAAAGPMSSQQKAELKAALAPKVAG